MKAMIPLGFALLFLQSLAQAIQYSKAWLKPARIPYESRSACDPDAGRFFVLLLIGIPVGLTLAATGFIFGYLGFGDDAVQSVAAPHLRRGD